MQRKKFLAQVHRHCAIMETQLSFLEMIINY